VGNKDSSSSSTCSNMVLFFLSKKIAIHPLFPTKKKKKEKKKKKNKKKKKKKKNLVTFVKMFPSVLHIQFCFVFHLDNSLSHPAQVFISRPVLHPKNISSFTLLCRVFGTLYY